ncbi:MAG TPA: branched-chain amino acid ABC transporter permease [Stellaceae bacterium]|nr:branched-chain amino acid ABC transporter permease [Stellaceae bacterium]
MRWAGKDALGAAGVLALLALIPAVTHSDYLIGILTVSLIFGIWAASWDFMSGLTGRENFGHALFIGAGAYTAALLNSKLDLSPWWCLPAGALTAVGFSLIIGFPTLRLRGPYFALAMLAAATIMQRLMRIFWEFTGGEEGIPGLDPLFESHVGTYYFCLFALTVTTAVLLALARSSWGTILRAIRGDEAACQAAGINVTFYKIAALMISAAFAGAGGVLYAHYQEAVTPDVFAVALSITIIIMVYVGGMGSIYGPVAGGIILALLPELLRGLGEYRLWVYSVILMLILFFAPGGLVAPLWRRLTAVAR